MPVPLYLITGFLGSGKTTLLRRFLDTFADDIRTGVIQNEFAAVHVDADELKCSGKTFHLLEVNRGSVFCVCLVADFKRTLAQFVDEHRPEALFLEATGLADPIAVAELFSAPELQRRLFLARVWCVVDAAKFLLLEKVNLCMSRQVRTADAVIINKTDAADEATIVAVENRISRLNPAAEIYRTAFCELSAAELRAGLQPAAAAARPKAAPHERPLGRPAVGTAVIKTPRKIGRAALERFTDQVAATAWRIKGLVHCADDVPLMVQTVFGKTQYYSMPDYRGLTELIVIGPHVRQQTIVERFRMMCE